MSTFFHQHRHNLPSIKRLVEFSTLIAPTQNGSHHRKAPIITTTTAENTDNSTEHGTAITEKEGPGQHRQCSTGMAGIARGGSTDRVVLVDATKEHLRTVYHELSGRHRSVPREKLRQFLEETQGSLVAPLEKEKYKFEEFLEVWFFQYMEALKPISVMDLDPTKSIANYFISSSHNTYLSGNQLSSEASVEAYKAVLEKNCRCIEIDVWNWQPKSGSRTPNRSRSPHPGHRRHLSKESVASAVQEGLEAVTSLLTGVAHHSRSHSRSPSANQQVFPHHSPRESSASLDPNAFNERPGRLRTRTNSRPRSPSQSIFARLGTSEPIVMHAHNLLSSDWTLGTWVGFREVCQAVRETAFVQNDLPVIVSLEVHADPHQQEVMVEIMKEEWNGLLLDQPIEGLDRRLRLPTLEEMKKKILIKVKKAPSKTTVPSGGTSGSLGVSLSAFEDDGSDDEKVVAKAKTVKICESLSKLAIYTHSAHFDKFDDREAKTPSHIFSLDENRIEALHETHHQELFKHNRTFLMRAYPSAKHVDSSNLDPAFCWRRGVQMVALNWQTCDVAMMLNYAMFAGTDGWVLKPKGYRSADRSLCHSETDLYKTLDLKITVLAGQHIPVRGAKKDSIPDQSLNGKQYKDFRPLVRCDLHVERAPDCCNGSTEAVAKVKSPQPQPKLQAKTPAGETNNPSWGPGGHTMVFRDVPKVIEELSFVR